jgi:hypothetical protein
VRSHGFLLSSASFTGWRAGAGAGAGERTMIYRARPPLNFIRSYASAHGLLCACAKFTITRFPKFKWWPQRVRGRVK